MKKSKPELFLELARPDSNGFSRWVHVSEFIGEYEGLKFGNGGSWPRESSTLAKKYKIERDSSLTKGNSIDRIRLVGFSEGSNITQQIRADIHKAIRKQRCVVLGISEVEVDHKDGRKNDPRIMNPKTQKETDFQPLSKAANTAKRQFCKECTRTDKRFDATRLGYPISFTEGGEIYNPATKCRGCFWYDPKEFRKKIYFTKWKK